MKNFWVIYYYECKKIFDRRQTVVVFWLILIATILLNLNSILIYSVGSEGEELPWNYVNENGPQKSSGRSAFLNGVEIRWIDEDGAVVTEKVNPLAYIRLQQEFARQWSGKKLDEETIQYLHDFVEKYEWDWETHDNYRIAWSYQNINWVWRTISNLGNNPGYEFLTGAMIQDRIEQVEVNLLYDYEQLTDEEQEFWQKHEKISFPLTMAYTPAYRQLLQNASWIHILLVAFVIFALCESFSLERRWRTRPLVQVTAKGQGAAVLARLLAGASVSAGAGVILHGVSAVIQFALFGTDGLNGWNAPIQQIGDYVWSRLAVTAGEAVLLMFGTSILILVFIGAFTMLLSEVFQNGNVPMWVQYGFLLFSLLFDYGIFHRNRTLSQLWQYFPLQRVNYTLLYDERLVSVGGHLFTAIPFSTLVYCGFTFLALALCGVHTVWHRRDT